MKPGEDVWVRVFKADSTPYRWWRPVVESIADDGLVVYSYADSTLFTPTRTFNLQRHFRSYLWHGRRHTLLEIYEPDGRLHELYADIISPIQVINGEIHLIDHELDVSMMAGEEPRIIDQDEFSDAAERYGYTPEFVNESYALAEQLLEVLANWSPRGLNNFKW